LQILQDGPVPDVLITDHAMPQMTGAELAAIVEERYPTVSIVLATGYAELPAGAGSHLLRLPKPFTEAQLSQALRSVDQDRLPGER
jgi:YesN/AraC family two-component response regulator